MAEPDGRPLKGTNRETYWYLVVAAGAYPPHPINEAVAETLGRLVRHRAFFHEIRSDGGRTELFVGWGFARQSGGILPYSLLGLAADLQIDLPLDIYPPTQPQNEHPAIGNFLPP
jgi:hypothetical protein